MTSEWTPMCALSEVDVDDVARVDIGEATYAVVHSKNGVCSVIDGLCTHAKAHLAEGFVDGNIIECPKHNGRFDVFSGKATATPARVAVRVYETRVVDDVIEARLHVS